MITIRNSKNKMSKSKFDKNTKFYGWSNVLIISHDEVQLVKLKVVGNE